FHVPLRTGPRPGDAPLYKVAASNIRAAPPGFASPLPLPVRVKPQPSGAGAMNEHIVRLLDQLKALEAEVDAEIAKNRAELRFGIEKGRVLFEEEVLRRHRELQTSLRTYIANAKPMIVLTAPVIYAMIVPLV